MDAANKKMSMEMTSSMETPDKAEMPDGPTEMTMVMYLVDNAMYMKMDMGIPGIPVQWTKMDMPEGYEDTWDSQNQMEQQIELLSISEVDLLKAETVNGVDCYVLKITPDMEKYSEFLMKQGGMSKLMQGMQEDFDIGKLIKGMSITQWIAKDTLFPMKTEMQMKMVIQPFGKMLFLKSVSQKPFPVFQYLFFFFCCHKFYVSEHDQFPFKTFIATPLNSAAC